MTTATTAPIPMRCAVHRFFGSSPSVIPPPSSYDSSLWPPYPFTTRSRPVHDPFTTMAVSAAAVVPAAPTTT